MSNDTTPGDVQQQQQQIPPMQKKDNTAMLVLSYLGILFLVPMLTEKDDPEVQWHAKHGMVLFIAEIIVFVAFGFLSILIGMIPYVGWLFSCLIWFVLPVGILVLHIMCILKATKGERMQIPMITEYVGRF